MAVIGSTLSLPSIVDVVSLKSLIVVLGFLAVVGVVWLIVDYGRMLRLHKQMVSIHANAL